MANSYTETTRRGWFSNIFGSVIGALVGVLFILIAFGLLWWNEGRTVKAARGLKEGASNVVSVLAERVDPANDAKLVHVTAEATTTDTVKDPEFGLESQAIALVRTVQMYQWREEKKSEEKTKLGGGTETTTTYNYTTEWSAERHDSASFKHPEGHENPGEFPWPSRTFTAPRVSLGAFTLSRDLVAKIENREARPVTASETRIPSDTARVRPVDGMYYTGDNPGSPKVGDVRVRFEVIKPQMVSVIARQRGDSFEAYEAQSGTVILMLEPGTVSADQMFREAVAHNRMIGWLLRGGGLLLMFVGFALVFRPLAVVGSVIPFVGSLLSTGTGLVAFLVALTLSLVTISLAWIAYRPIIAVGLIVVAIGAIVLLRKLHTRRVPPPPVQTPPVQPPPLPAEARQ